MPCQIIRARGHGVCFYSRSVQASICWMSSQIRRRFVCVRCVCIYLLSPKVNTPFHPELFKDEGIRQSCHDPSVKYPFLLVNAGPKYTYDIRIHIGHPLQNFAKILRVLWGSVQSSCHLGVKPVVTGFFNQSSCLVPVEYRESESVPNCEWGPFLVCVCTSWLQFRIHCSFSEVFRPTLLVVPL